MMLRRLTVLCCLALLLAACAPDPRDAADAYRTTLLADQQAADQAQARAMRQEEWERTLPKRLEALNWALLIGSISLCVFLATAAIGGSWAAIGAGRAAARAAIVRANLIPLDAATRQFPLLLNYLGRGRYSLVDPNTEMVTLLDTRQPADRDKFRQMGMVKLAGVVAQEAGKHAGTANILEMGLGEVIGRMQEVER
jgi:hypothetical protein